MGLVWSGATSSKGNHRAPPDRGKAYNRRGEGLKRFFGVSYGMFSPCRKGGRQKGIGKKVTKSVKKVTKRLPKGDRNRKK